MKSSYAPSEGAVITAGVLRVCQIAPGFQGFLQRALSTFETSKDSRIFCRFNEVPYPGISVCRDPMGLTVVTMEGEY